MIPQIFLDRMKKLLDDGYPDFLEALSEPNVRAIRVNTLKCEVDKLLSLWEGELAPIEYTKDGFIPTEQSGIGNTPEHHSGMIYVQDPGAMAPINAVDIPRGARVLDTCSAPGGKSSQLAAAIGSEGLLVANEYVPKRAKTVVSNFERLGITNAIVTSLDTSELGEMFKNYFDVVLCDAPCSGEGMFRKCDDAITDWSEENVQACAKRQLEILSNVIGTIKDGGTLIYSTCTYSVEENEGVVLEIMCRFPSLDLIDVKDELKAFTKEGIVIDGHGELKRTRRFYPHVQKGEGQFVAVFKKHSNTDVLPTILYKQSEISPTKKEMAIVDDFIKSNLTDMPKGRFIKQGNGISFIPFDIPLPPRNVFMAGVMLGEIKGAVFFPHHQLFSAFGGLFRRVRNLEKGDPCCEKYLRGEEIDAGGTDNGWCVVAYEGVALGGGKVSGSKIKNHYPKGLRIK